MYQNIHLCPILFISVVQNYFRGLKWRKMWYGYLNEDECFLLAHFIQNYICIILENNNISVFSKSTGRNSLLTGLFSKAERPEYKKTWLHNNKKIFQFFCIWLLYLTFCKCIIIITDISSWSRHSFLHKSIASLQSLEFYAG